MENQFSDRSLIMNTARQNEKARPRVATDRGELRAADLEVIYDSDEAIFLSDRIMAIKRDCMEIIRAESVRAF